MESNPKLVLEKSQTNNAIESIVFLPKASIWLCYVTTTQILTLFEGSLFYVRIWCSSLRDKDKSLKEKVVIKVKQIIFIQINKTNKFAAQEKKRERKVSLPFVFFFFDF